jgi:mRNA interferase YafQ
MLNIVYSNQFKKDVKMVQRHGKNMSKFKVVVELLIKKQQLPKALRDHPLKGEWRGYRDLHIEPDWLLIYKIDKLANVIRFERTGSHAELF